MIDGRNWLQMQQKTWIEILYSNIWFILDAFLVDFSLFLAYFYFISSNFEQKSCKNSYSIEK